MKDKTYKCHVSFKGIQVGESSLCEKLLGVKIDYKLTFDSHVKSFCKKSKQ